MYVFVVMTELAQESTQLDRDVGSADFEDLWLFFAHSPVEGLDVIKNRGRQAMSGYW
jgi:hypothetical protein